MQIHKGRHEGNTQGDPLALLAWRGPPWPLHEAAPLSVRLNLARANSMGVEGCMGGGIHWVGGCPPSVSFRKSQVCPSGLFLRSVAPPGWEGRGSTGLPASGRRPENLENALYFFDLFFGCIFIYDRCVCFCYKILWCPPLRRVCQSVTFHANNSFNLVNAYTGVNTSFRILIQYHFNFNTVLLFHHT